MGVGVPRIPMLIAGLALLGGCDRDQTDTSPAASRRLSAEAFAALPALRLDLGKPVCSVDAPATSCELGPTGDVVTDGRSGLLLNDPSQKALRFITSTSGAPRSLGRPGQGPGEFRMIFSIGLGQDGQAAAFDGEQRKTIRFDSAGRASEVRHPSLPGGVVAMDFIDGELWAVGGDIKGNTANGDSVPILLYRAGGNGRFQEATRLPLHRPGLGIEDMRPPAPIFAPQELWHFARDGRVLHTDGGALTVEVYDTAGRFVLQFGAAASPRRVTDAEFQREYEARIARLPGGAMGRAMRVQAGHRVPTHAAITALRQLQNGQIWIREAPTESGDSVGWVVLHGDGAPIGRLLLPADVRILAAIDSNLVILPHSVVRPAVLTWATLRGGK